MSDKVKDVGLDLLKKLSLWTIGLFSPIFIVVVIVVIVIFGASSTSSKSNCEFTNVETENIQNLIPYIETLMVKYNIPSEQKPLIISQIHQESGDIQEILTTDPMQSSEYYCGSMGCITDPEVSIDQGLKLHSENIKKYEKLELGGVEEDAVLQAYNFGSGYLDYLAETKQEHSEDVAYEYSVKMTKENPEYGEVCSQDPKGKACYGDYKYVSHVRSKGGWVCDDSTLNGELTTLPELAGTYTVSQDYGYQAGGEWHDGIDIVGVDGAIIYSAGDGQVVFSGVEPLGANVVQIKNEDGIYTSYAHLKEPSELEVGDEVHAGDKIGIQGNSGNSTGSHLHFEVRVEEGFSVGAKYTNNPENYLPIEENQK